MNTQLVKFEKRGDVVWLTLNSPDKMNALSIPMLQHLERAVDALSNDDTARCVVITGAGRAFCAGGDLQGFQADLAEPTKERFLDRLRYAQIIFERIETLPMPTIAAVNGYAIAGGLELLLCCDIVVASQSSRIGDGHAKYGIIPAGGSSARLPRKISANRANYLLLSAEILPAETLERWGLVNFVVPDDELHGTAAKLANTISRHSPLGLRVIKKLARDGMNGTSEQAVRAEIDAFAEYAGSEDLAEGLAAFAEKRSPGFKGC